MNGDGGLEGRRSKKVISNRNQRSDFGFMEGAFGEFIILCDFLF